RNGVVRARPFDHCPGLVALEPAHLGELFGVDRDLLGQRFAEEAHHQARRKRPWLRGEIAYPPDLNARFLEDFATHSLLQSLARFHETGETRESSPGAPVAAAQQAPLAPDREHDHDRVDARKVVRLAIGAMPHPAARDDSARRAALRAVAVPGMPVDQGARLGENCRLAAVDYR